MAAEKEYSPKNQQVTKEFSQRVMVVGDPGAGKSSLIASHVGGRIDTNPFAKPKEKTIQGLDAKGTPYLIKQEICDTHGVEGYKFRLCGERQTDGMIVVFDTTNRDSFKNVASWLGKVEHYLQGDKIPAVLVGTKSDQPNRQVTGEEAKEFAAAQEISYVECSAKLNAGVRDVFSKLGGVILLSHGIYSHGIDIPGINMPINVEKLKKTLKEILPPQAAEEMANDERAIDDLRIIQKAATTQTSKLSPKALNDTVTEMSDIVAAYVLKGITGRYDELRKGKENGDSYLRIKQSAEKSVKKYPYMSRDMKAQFALMLGEIQEGIKPGSGRDYFNMVSSIVGNEKDALSIKAQKFLDRPGITSSVSVDAISSGSSSHPYGIDAEVHRQRSQSAAPPPLPPRPSPNPDGIEEEAHRQRSQSAAPPLPPRPSPNPDGIGMLPQHQRSQSAVPPPRPARTFTNPDGIGVQPQHQRSHSTAVAPGLPPRPFASRVAAGSPPSTSLGR